MIQRPPPPGADPNLWAWFCATDTDASNSITADELKQILLTHQGVPYNDETIRLMINMHDPDHTGTIDFNEFSALWGYLLQWGACFREFDLDNSGTIDQTEMSNALLRFGYRLTDELIQLIMRKHDKFGFVHFYSPSCIVLALTGNLVLYQYLILCPLVLF